MDFTIFGDEATEGTHPSVVTQLDAQAAIERLRAGNEAYLSTDTNDGDTSLATVKRLFEEGQAPFACVVSCADSRVVPEHIFMTGLGELFCIRVAGNVVGAMELASCVYAAEHLHVPLVLVLGHTHCGAIEAAMVRSIGSPVPPAESPASSWRRFNPHAQGAVIRRLWPQDPEADNGFGWYDECLTIFDAEWDGLS